ncbi:MAG TPA: hypothetical protein VF459_12445 [Caulobacteraceae bacterium]
MSTDTQTHPAHPVYSDPATLAVHAGAYHRFMLGLKWVVLTLASTIVLLTLWFATPAGFAGGLVTAVVLFALGVFAMNHGLAHSSESDNPV